MQPSQLKMVVTVDHRNCMKCTVSFSGTWKWPSVTSRCLPSLTASSRTRRSFSSTESTARTCCRLRTCWITSAAQFHLWTAWLQCVMFFYCSRCSLLFPAPLPPALGGGIKRWCCLTSAVCLSVAYIGPKSRTERPRKTKLGTELSHVTRDSDTIFKVKRLRSQGAGAYCGSLSHSLFWSGMMK